uniref:Uncharacterized protein n=1 Tax=Strigops habroptila TaxID=2489341 RepID=A0A672UJG9_STRHB
QKPKVLVGLMAVCKVQPGWDTPSLNRNTRVEATQEKRVMHFGGHWNVQGLGLYGRAFCGFYYPSKSQKNTCSQQLTLKSAFWEDV